MFFIVELLELDWRDIADGREQPAVVEPIDPFEGLELHVLEVAPRAALADELCLVKANDRLGQIVGVGVADAADGGFDAGLGAAVRCSGWKDTAHHGRCDAPTPRFQEVRPVAFTHQVLGRAPCYLLAFSVELLPDLVGAIDQVAFVLDALNLLA